MASWDTPAVPSPGTANYAAPLVNFSAIANLPNDYYAGKEMAYKSRRCRGKKIRRRRFAQVSRKKAAVIRIYLCWDFMARSTSSAGAVRR